MNSFIASPVVSKTGKTRLQASLDRATARQGPSIGQWLEFPGYSLARTVAPLGADWVLIDCEHGNIDDKEMYLQVGAISSAGVSPIVRIPASEPWMMKRALDCGAHAIMVPMCETKGLRGAGAMFAPAAFDQTGREYLTHANDNVMIIVQIESRTAVDNCAAIAAVPGIDMLFVGPNDLASFMGYFALDHAQIPEVQKATTRVLQAAKDAGKYAGHFALSADVAAAKYHQGFDFVNSGADIVALTSWMSTEMSKLRQLTDSTTSKEELE
ncbi:hypothetical protein ASPBRDRAFT_27131 [Aspergillus brasiliensis CBS 101740]|uniref:HpcH/HpaI aldolase/citrate lyase domain-containing protein n=1 Tax=Aspergillus brasiliensis (strain CBS 101740 / IMI 381727 / IBT 21946) TaxID=767769 RepID=A0A1L9UYS6_ASPBC|nr:hypothetical protein ASPBRDRAFT_27131 [Aspergillus brasiliensis CBS 101740]